MPDSGELLLRERDSSLRSWWSWTGEAMAVATSEIRMRVDFMVLVFEDAEKFRVEGGRGECSKMLIQGV